MYKKDYYVMIIMKTLAEKMKDLVLHLLILCCQN